MPLTPALSPQARMLVKSLRDPQVEWAKKGGKRYFGYKVHVGVDQGSAICKALAAR